MQVSFILPLYNQLALTRACLASLRATVPANVDHEIILVDDASTDETRDFLRELAPPHVVLRNDRNRGYAAANNRAAHVAQGEFLALLNNDLILEPRWLEPLLAAFTLHPRAGIVGNIQLNAATGAIDHAGVVFRDGGYPVHHRDLPAGELAEFPAVTAACCLVRREWFLRAGGFDEGYHNGFEDTDLCLRAREDGLVNLVATASVVRHHVSSSEGRRSHEFRNARRFLARWAPRTAALEREWNLKLARDHAAAAARRYFTPLHRKLGGGTRALRHSHRTALAQAQRDHHASSRRLRIGVDLLRLQPGGANGGVKPFVLSFLAEIGRQRGAEFNFAVFAPAAVRDDLAGVLRPGDYVLAPAADQFTVTRRQPNGWRAAGTLAAAGNVAAQAGLDVLYAPFGTSQFMQADLPCVSLVVDLLHRDLPAALPPEEVNHRHQWFTQIAAQSTYFQCNSRHVVGRLGAHYGVHPARCFPGPRPDPGPDPGDTGRARFLNRKSRGALHHQVPHAVVTVNQRGTRALLYHVNIRPRIDAAGTDALRVLRQSNDAVAVRTLQIRVRHQPCHGESVGGGHTQPLESRADERTQARVTYGDGGGCHAHRERGSEGAREQGGKGFFFPLPLNSCAR